MMLDIDKKLMELAEKASILPWRYVAGAPPLAKMQVTGSVWSDEDLPTQPVVYKPLNSDAAYIVAAANAIPVLLKRIEALRDALLADIETYTSCQGCIRQRENARKAREDDERMAEGK